MTSPAPRPETARPLDATAAAVMILLCASWGLNHVIMKWAYRDISPLLAAAVRSGVALLPLLLYCRLKGEKLSAPNLAWLHGAAVGCLFSGEFIFMYVGFNLTLASRGTIFVYTQPFFTALLAHLFLPGERLNWWRGGGLILAFVGLSGVLWDRPHTGQASLVGDIFCMLGGFFWAATNVYVRRFLVGRATFLQSVLWQLLYSVPILLAACLILESPYLNPTPGLAGAVLYQAVIVAFVSYLIFFRLLYRHQAPDLAAFTFFTPIFGVAFSILVMGDALTVGLLVGLGLVSVGVWMVNRH